MQNEPTETLNIENQENQGQKATPLNEKDKKDKPKRKLEQKQCLVSSSDHAAHRF
jgi:hypothetical protein